MSETQPNWPTFSEKNEERLTDVFGEEYQECLTPYGAQKLIMSLEDAERESPGYVEDGDECPVCGEEIINAHEYLEDFEGESVEIEKVCVVDFPDHSVLHVSDDRINPSDLED